MNTSLLPILPVSPARSAGPCPRANAAADTDAESFATLLDQQAAPGRSAVENAEPTADDAVGASEGAHESDETDTLTTPVFAPAIQLPLLPYTPIAAPVPDGISADAADADDAASAGESTPARPALAETAGNGAPTLPQSLPILAAMFPMPMAQLQAQLGRAENRANPSAQLRSGPLRVPATIAAAPAVAAPVLATPQFLAGSIAVQAPTFAAPRLATEYASAAPVATFLGDAPAIGSEGLLPLANAASAPLPQLDEPVLPAPSLSVATPREIEVAVSGEIAPAIPATPQLPRFAAPEVQPSAAVELAISNAPNTAQATAQIPVETAIANAPQNPRGTSAAKRGEVMQNATIELPATVRPAKAAGEETPLVEPRPVRRSTVVLPAALGAAKELPLTLAPVAPTTAPERDRNEASDRQQSSAPRVEIETALPVNAPAMKPHFENPHTDAPAGTQITRTEVVQLADRTADAALRMRAIGQERVEVAVQLASGDQVTIQLRMANGEVTPIIRTNSEALRTALEQNWTGFSERTADRGVRLTQPVFDVNSSSSNMADLSQQRHGRDTAFTDSQGELFRHLPPRIRPPRVLAPSTIEPATTVDGVRLYA